MGKTMRADELRQLEKEFYAVMHDFDDDPALLDAEFEAQANFLLINQPVQIDYSKITQEIAHGIEDIPHD
jgi:hypothetical protein